MTIVQAEQAAPGQAAQQKCPVTGTPGSACPVARGPKGLPVIGVAPTYFKDPPAYSLRLQQDHGSMVGISLPKPFIQITDADAVEQVLRTNPDNYLRGTLYRGFLGFMGRGLLTLDTEHWKVHRKVVQPAFAPKRVDQDAAEAVPATLAVLRRWQQAARTGAVIDIAPDAMGISTRTMGRALIGRDLSEPGLDYARASAVAGKAMYTSTILGLNELVPGFVPSRYNREKRWAQRVIGGIVNDVVASRRRSGELGTDAAGLLLASDLGDQAAIDDLRTLLLAGTDTTGQALTWTLYELARHPQARQEVEEEVDRVLDGQPPAADQLADLPATRRAIEESMRLHPPVWQFPRDAIEDEDVAGWHVPGGSTVLLSPYCIHRSAAYWQDPEAFDPSRFEEEPSKARHRHAYIPFGGGRRLCIGKGLAMATLITAVAMISQRLRLRLVSAPPVRYDSYITMFPVNGVPVAFSERR